MILLTNSLYRNNARYQPTELLENYIKHEQLKPTISFTLYNDLPDDPYKA